MGKKKISQNEKELNKLHQSFEIYNSTPKVVFDIGASVGRYSFLLSEKLPLTKIYAFEPVKKSYEELKSKIQKKDFFKQRIFPYNFGILSENKETNVGIPGHRADKETNVGLYSVHTSTPGKDYGIHTVSFRKLQDVCEELDAYPDLIKIDAEGCEFEILHSIKDDILKNVKTVFIEVNYSKDFPDPRKVNQLLESEGFKDFFPSLTKDRLQQTWRKRGFRRMKTFNRVWCRE